MGKSTDWQLALLVDRPTTNGYTLNIINTRGGPAAKGGILR